MKNKISLFFVCGLLLVLSACGLQNNITVTTNAGSCPNNVNNAPYCMAVTLQSGGGGQNWITNTNYPITDLTVSVSGATNILTPSSNSSLDPNGCTTSNINPGNSCTFYLKINQNIFDFYTFSQFL